MRPVHSPYALLVPLAVVALASGCPEQPPPVEAQARLFASAAESEVVQGRDTAITVTSVKADGTAGTGDVTATIEPRTDPDTGDTLPSIGRIAVSGAAPTEQSASAALSATGIATFDFACDVTGNAEPIEATITLSGDTGDAKTKVTCTPQVITRTVVLGILDCQSRLQADGASSCTVDVTVRDATGNAVPDVALDVKVEEVTVIGAGAANENVLKAAATDAGAATSSLDDVRTDANGVGRFAVVSPAVRLEQTMKISVVDDAGNSGAADIVIAPFEDKSQVTISASATSISANDTTTITVIGRLLNGDPAVGRVATVVVPPALVVTEAGCITAATAPNTFDARLEDGSCTFTVTAGAVATDVTVNTSFQAATEGALRTDDVTISIVDPTATVATVTTDATRIFADNQDPGAATITVEVKRGGNAVAGATVSAVVGSASRGIIKLATQQVGSVPSEAVADEDAASVTSDADGTVSFTVIADNATSRGNGSITITVVDSNGVAFDVVAPETVTVTVDREPLLSSLVFDGFDPDSVIGVPGGPRASSTGVKFRLLDEQNDPVANVPVRFVAQSSVPGISIVPFGTSDSSGIVTTVVTAGRVAGPITVVALIDSPALSAVSPAISVIGGLPNSAYSSVVCDTVAAQNPSTDCTVVLADKFTNLVETNLNVQFRAEGGNITPSAEATGGTATASFIAGPPGAGSADVRNWSYAPLRTPPAAVISAFPGCFDNTTRTACDLVALCTNASSAIRAFCPLPPSSAANAPPLTSCASDINALALDALTDEASNPGDWEFSLFADADSGSFTAAEVQAQFDAYVAGQRTCGITLACITGDANGLSLDDSDDCPVNAGCLDFNGATECPQDGLLDILAAVRGEEGFDDENGNGVRDGGESFVDFPEPFLDKNSSCSYDSLNDLERLTASQKIQLSDLFIDSDSTDGLFGFNIGGGREETNGVFDSDTEVFLKTSVVQLGAAQLQFGFEVNPAVCGADGATNVVCPAGAQAATGAQSRCSETARGEAILENCLPGGDNFRDGETASYVFRWTDANGNCPTNDFSGEPAVTVEGPAEIAVNDSPYSQVECGAVPGGAGSKNLERPWCEEHVNMGAPAREITLIGKCEGETGDQVVKLTFELDGAIAVRTFVLSCPVCGDNLVEGEEQCDDGNRDVGDGCDADCAAETP